MAPQCFQPPRSLNSTQRTFHVVHFKTAVMSFWPLALPLPHHPPSHAARAPPWRETEAGTPHITEERKKKRNKQGLTVRQDLCMWSIETVSCKGQAGLFVKMKWNLLWGLTLPLHQHPALAWYIVPGEQFSLLIGAWLQGGQRQCQEIKTRLISFTFTHLKCSHLREHTRLICGSTELDSGVCVGWVCFSCYNCAFKGDVVLIKMKKILEFSKLNIFFPNFSFRHLYIIGFMWFGWGVRLQTSIGNSHYDIKLVYWTTVQPWDQHFGCVEKNRRHYAWITGIVLLPTFAQTALYYCEKSVSVVSLL